MRQTSRRLLRILGLASLILLFVLLERRFHLSANLAPERVEQWLESLGLLGPVAFVLVMALSVIVSPIPSLPLDILGGRVFGSVLGTTYAAIGATLGAIASFLLSRLLGRDLLPVMVR